MGKNKEMKTDKNFDEFCIKTMAEENNIPEISGILESNLSFLEERDAEGNGILNYAVVSGDLNKIKYFCGEGVILERDDVGQKNVFKISAAENINIGMTNDAGSNALHLLATCSGSVEIAKFLCDVGMNPDAVNIEGNTPLHISVATRCLKLTDFFAGRMKNLDVLNDEGMTLLMEAVISEDEEVVELLLKNGASVTTVDEKGRTPLHMAALSGNKSIAEMLLQNGADVFAVDKEDNSPIFTVLLGKEGELKDILGVLHEYAAKGRQNVYEVKDRNFADGYFSGSECDESDEEKEERKKISPSSVVMGGCKEETKLRSKNVNRGLSQ